MVKGRLHQTVGNQSIELTDNGDIHDFPPTSVMFVLNGLLEFLNGGFIITWLCCETFWWIIKFRDPVATKHNNNQMLFSRFAFSFVKTTQKLLL